MHVSPHRLPNHSSPAGRVKGGLPGSGGAAFTLIEMLVVLGIIGILAAMTLPSFKSAGKGNVLESAMRQLQDDLAQARLKAMSGRTKVYVVFAPDYNWFTSWSTTPVLPASCSPNLGSAYTAANLNSAATTNYLFFNSAANNVIGGQLTSYALFAPRLAGDQPGQSTPRYLSEWHSLPAGAFIPAAAFRHAGIFHNVPGSPLTNGIPVDESPGAWAPPLPYIAFDEQGRLFRHTNSITLGLVEGSVLHPKEPTGQTNLVVATDAVETSALVAPGQIVAGIEYLVAGTPGSTVRYPPAGPVYTAGQTFVGTAGNTNYLTTGTPRLVQLYGLRVDALTGRARAVRPEIQ